MQGPRHLVFHPELPVAFTTNEQGNSVSVYDLDAATGLLTYRSVASTTPDGFSAALPLDSGCAQLRIHPSGRWLFAPNRDQQPHDTVAVFAVDAETGDLAAAPPTAAGAHSHSNHLCRFHFQLISLRCAGEYGSAWPACEAHSRGIALDEAGAHLYVAGTRSGVLRTYTVDESTGRLADCAAERFVGESPVRFCSERLEPLACRPNLPKRWLQMWVIAGQVRGGGEGARQRL